MSGKSSRIGVVAAAALASFGLAASPTPYHDQEERYVFVASRCEHPYWQEAQAAAIGRRHRWVLKRK
jgi:hypothetical protein